MAKAGMTLMNGRNEIVKNGEKKTKNLFHAILIFRGSLLHWLAYLIRLAVRQIVRPLYSNRRWTV